MNCKKVVPVLVAFVSLGMGLQASQRLQAPTDQWDRSEIVSERIGESIYRFFPQGGISMSGQFSWCGSKLMWKDGEADIRVGGKLIPADEIVRRNGEVFNIFHVNGLAGIDRREEILREHAQNH